MEWYATGVGHSLDGYQLDLRAKIAVSLCEHNGILLGTPSGEDSAGRSVTANMSAVETVQRAVSMADLLVNEFEKRNWIKKSIDVEEDFKRVGELEDIKHQALYSRIRAGKD